MTGRQWPMPRMRFASGRLSDAAEALIRFVAPEDPVERVVEVAAAKSTLSCLLQLGST